MIEKEKFERHLRGTNLLKTRFHRICLRLINIVKNTTMSPRESCVCTRYGPWHIRASEKLAIKYGINLNDTAFLTDLMRQKTSKLPASISEKQL